MMQSSHTGWQIYNMITVGLLLCKFKTDKLKKTLQHDFKHKML